eukprot:1160286-Pelagomonas_calceolata.AAC.3
MPSTKVECALPQILATWALALLYFGVQRRRNGKVAGNAGMQYQARKNRHMQEQASSASPIEMCPGCIAWTQW